ncbi:hypothetical protein [Kitasatospora purpeofusca]|uniref:hypothetical protein n=1 Tax=Kitasatospora purpeofusca TaxID=67352 RepID=UPI00225641B0|nr:hypothetical protein [Kitasatospora purpeofusca]MCX4756329.1 hypothetical protein [Kitasatospora purpeofusca]WSR35845.1 hypothetical protein OG715_35770 [Kitasatospora purpeofusca]WSR44154.1 hypothetical protein OG196_36745 [Kitasatospora purpeofusca]
MGRELSKNDIVRQVRSDSRIRVQVEAEVSLDDVVRLLRRLFLGDAAADAVEAAAYTLYRD